MTIALENPTDDVDAALNDRADAAQSRRLSTIRWCINYDRQLPAHRRARPRMWTWSLPYYIGLHLKDLRQEGEGWVHTALGDGSIMWDEMFDRMAPLTAQPLLSIEIPARMRRDSGQIVLQAGDAPGPDRRSSCAPKRSSIQIARLNE